MATIGVAETFRSSFLLFREAMPTLVRRVLPVIAIAQAIDLLPLTGNDLLLLILAILSWLASAWASAFGLRIMLRLRDSGSAIWPGVVSLVLFSMVLAYVTVATSLGFLLLVVPALIVSSAAVLAPVFALEQNQGPFESVASSTDCAKGNLLPIAKVVLLLWAGLAVLSALLGIVVVPRSGFAASMVGYVGSVALSFAALYHYAVVAVLFERLSPNPAVQGTLRDEAAQRP